MVSTYGDKLIMHLTSHAHAKSSLVLLNLSRHPEKSNRSFKVFVDATDNREVGQTTPPIFLTLCFRLRNFVLLLNIGGQMCGAAL